MQLKISTDYAIRIVLYLAITQTAATSAEISAKMGIFYWINMILACLIFPVVPLVYAAVLTMLVMRLFKNIRNKDFLSYLGFAASLIFAIGINVFSRSIGNF